MNEKTINYSVIIPHFSKGGTALLERAVSSIPERDDVETIIVDNSLSPIDDKLFDSRSNTNIYYSDNSLGAGGARNVGLGYAKGKWLLFMDADDYFVEDAFKIFDQHIDSDSDIIYFKPTSSFSDSGLIADRHDSFCKAIDDYIETKDGRILKYSSEFEVPWSKMFKHKLIDEKQITFEEVPASNDVMFSLKTALAAQNIEAVNAVVYCVTVTKGSITNVESLRNLESVFNVRIRKNQLLKENGLKKESSVANIIRKSAHYGFPTFCRFFWRALISGNILVGCDRWLKTIITYNEKFTEYKSKE